jgi:hypothetical protein
VEYVLSLLLKLDTAIQKRFDSACFFLMRNFGTKKSTIRYGLSAIGVLSWGFSIFFSVQATSSAWVGFFLMWYGIRTVFTLLLLQYDASRKDAIAEHSQEAHSRADSEAHGAFKLIWVVLSVTAWMIASGVLVTPTFNRLVSMEAWEVRRACSSLAVFLVIRLTLEYLKKTPMNPPAKKAREHVGTPQTAPAET